MVVGILKALFSVDASRFKAGMEDVKASTNQAVASINKSRRSLVGLKTGLIATGVAAVAVAMKISRMARVVEAIDQKLKFVAGSAEKAEDSFKFLVGESNRLGVSLKVLSREFANFSAAAMSSKMRSEEIRGIFSAVAEASAVLRMDTQTTSLTFLALSQMMSKGVIMSEELNRQLGDHLPGAVQIMAKTLGVTVMEMRKMMETGGLLADEILPRFAKTLHEDVKPGLEDLDKALSVAVGRMETAWFMFQKTFLGQESLITQSLKITTNVITAFLNTFSELAESQEQFGGLFPNAVRELDRLDNLFNKSAETLVAIEEEKQKEIYKVDYVAMQKRINLQEKEFEREKGFFEDRHNTIQELMQNTLDSSLKLMQDWALGGKASFKDFANSILMDLLRIVHEISVAQPLMDSLRAFLHQKEAAGGGSGGVFSGIASIFSGIFTSTKAFASGGIISEPVTGIGLSSGQRYTFGEEGAEAVIPMNKKQSQDQPQANNNVSVTINALDSKSLTELLRDNPQAVTLPIIDAIQGGDRGLTASLRGAL